MTDSLGPRMKFGVIAPSTNASVQPEFDAMRPAGVTNQMGRIMVAGNAIHSDDDFERLNREIEAARDDAIDRVMTCDPGHLIVGMSTETTWDGLEGGEKLYQHIKDRAGVEVTMASDAVVEALKVKGGIKRIGVVSPYQRAGDENVVRFFSANGFEVTAIKGLRCESPVLIAHVSEGQLRDAILEVDSANVDAIVQVGTNLAMARLAGIAENWLRKPVIAVNTATYWRALRSNGIDNKVEGWGSLLSVH